MSRRCQLNTSKGTKVGNKVSHSNVKTKRRFAPNLQNFSLFSDLLNRKVRFKATVQTIRSVEHNYGIDNYLLNSTDEKLDKKARKLKKALFKRANSINGTDHEQETKK